MDREEGHLPAERCARRWPPAEAPRYLLAGQALIISPEWVADDELKFRALRRDPPQISHEAVLLVLVEGVTDALVLRQLGLARAAADVSKQEFVDALTIVPMGSKVGEWTVQLLAT